MICNILVVTNALFVEDCYSAGIQGLMSPGQFRTTMHFV